MTPRSSIGLMGAVTIAVAIFLSGCGSTAHVEKDSSAKLSSYKTYGWIDNAGVKKAKSDPRRDLAEQNIRKAVNEQLQKKGYVESTTAPDLLVSSDLLVEKSQKEEKDPVYSPSYTRSYYNARTGRTSTYYFPQQFQGYDSRLTTVKEGTVTVTMIDNKTDKTVWQGWASRELLNKNITSKEIDQNVRSIFRKFDAEN